ncbi:Cytochrome p450 [Thalictrum thalictroides]|uniref:Cytochrome p450 n=1 Tax=Thalictrum thalictroides TaxID=46969 RepID=A0A7J6X0M1_THATH|nr:Cytochrome p450 [Thalictrum thalictroides]
MGTRIMIFVSNADLVHEALIEKGQIFASRPAETPTRTIFSCDKFTVNSAVYGPVWRSLRRNMVQGMLSTRRLKDFRNVRESAMDKLVDRIRVEAKANNGAVWVLKNARFAVFCILLSMCFGVEMDEKTIEKIDDLLKTVLITLNARLDDYLPILSPFFSKQRKRVMEVREEQLQTLVPFINKRRSALKNPGSDPTAATFAYLDTLFDLTVEGRKSVPTDTELVTLCSELLNGGTDTTATGLEWAIARLIDNPDIQSKLYNEIKSAVGNRKVDEKDVEKMEYLNAFTKELLRKHPPTHFSLTHAVTQPAKLGGYDVPTDATVEIYLPSISDDPTLWSKPEVFDPDRFLSGKEEADITGTRDIKMIPFGAGRRICPGLSMAMIHVNLMVARMVQEFEWSALATQKKIDFTEKLEFTTVMKYTLQAIAKPRI